MTRTLRNLFLGLALLTATTGCGMVQRVLKGTDPKTFATTRALMKDRKYIEAADELRRLQA